MPSMATRASRRTSPSYGWLPRPLRWYERLVRLPHWQTRRHPERRGSSRRSALLTVTVPRRLMPSQAGSHDAPLRLTSTHTLNACDGSALPVRRVQVTPFSPMPASSTGRQPVASASISTSARSQRQTEVQWLCEGFTAAVQNRRKSFGPLGSCQRLRNGTLA